MKHPDLSSSNTKNFEIKIRKTEIHVISMLSYEIGLNLIKSHKIKQLSQGVQNWYGYPCFRITWENEKSLEEIRDS